MTRDEIMMQVAAFTQLPNFHIIHPAILAENLLVELEMYGDAMQQSTRMAVLLVSATLLRQHAVHVSSDAEAQLIVERLKRAG
jgi:hypothetical protein